MTSAISSFTAPVAPQAPAMPAMPAPNTGFARMLSQRQAMAQEAAKPPVADKAAATAADEPAAPQPAARRANQAGERPPAKAEKQVTPDPAKASSAKETEGEEAAAADEAGADPEAIDPALADWLAALNFPTPAADAPATGRARGAALAGDEAGQNGAAAKGVARAKPGVELAIDPRDDAAQQAGEPALAAHAGRNTPDAATSELQAGASGWQAVAEQLNAPAELQARHDTPVLGALGAAAQVPTAARAAEAAAPVSVNLPTPATAPEFAQSLGVQVSVLARGGVQQAELHLNPADMGPISVQIALDGTQAQVNFGADSAATRQIIESGLPELAAALRDAGFTLSGGGVQGQARGRGEGGTGEHGSGREGTPSETEVTPQRVNARVAAGGVDLYA
jgi:flagellar hook-length control protein FliK